MNCSGWTRRVIVAALSTTVFCTSGTASAQAAAEEGAAVDSGEIIVTGHTDSVGTVESNDQLSLQRASALRDLLVQRGFDRARVDAVGRGERQPVVPTSDSTAEPRNRRAEITIR